MQDEKKKDQEGRETKAHLDGVCNRVGSDQDGEDGGPYSILHGLVGLADRRDDLDGLTC